MKSRNTLILLVLALGVGSYLWFVDRHQLSTEEQLARKGEIVEKDRVDRDKVSAVTIRNSEGTIQLKKTDGAWSLIAPVADRAEGMTIAALFTALEGLRGRQVDAAKLTKESAKEFGVAKGELSVKLEGGPQPLEILIGKESAVEGKVYARVEGSDAIYTVEKNLRDELAKGIKEWRDRKLSDLTTAQIQKINLKTAKGELELEKKQNHWAFAKPLKARGDDQKISDLISSATTPRIEEFITDSKDLGAYGLNEPRATVTFTAEGVKDPVILQIGAAKAEKKDAKPEDKKDEKPEEKKDAPPQFVYAKISTRQGVMLVPAAIESLINTQPNDLRDQNLIRVQADMVDRLTIEAPGKEKIVLGRKGEEWVRKIEGKNDVPVNSSAAAKLLTDLTTIKVTRFVADMTSDLKTLGLDAPTTVTLSSYSTEGTPETKPGDRPLVKVMLGKFEGDAGYAKLDDEPFIVAVSNTLLENLWTDTLQWQDLKINDLKKEDITGLEITRTGQPALAFTFEKDKGWKLAKGDGTVNQIAAQSLVNTLSTLRAVRWIGATDAAKHGLEKPNLTVQFTLADKKTGKLTIGNNTPDEMWHATSEGKSGTFLVNKPDFDALNAALIEAAKSAAAAPAPAATPGASAVTPPVTVTTPPVSVPAAQLPPAETPKPADAK